MKQIHALLRRARKKYRRDGLYELFRVIPPYVLSAIQKRVRKWRLRHGCVSVGQTRIKTGSEISEQVVDAVRDSLESEERALVSQVPRTVPVIELGAGIGIVSNKIDKHLHEGVPQIAVELDPALQESLGNTRKLNNACFDIVIAGYAPGGSEVTFERDGRYIYTQVTQDGTSCSPAISLTEICEKYNIREFVLVVDIEGSEEGLLEEWEFLVSCCRDILIEFHEGAEEIQSKVFNSHEFSLVSNIGESYYFTRSQ